MLVLARVPSDVLQTQLWHAGLPTSTLKNPMPKTSCVDCTATHQAFEPILRKCMLSVKVTRTLKASIHCSSVARRLIHTENSEKRCDTNVHVQFESRQTVRQPGPGESKCIACPDYFHKTSLQKWKASVRHLVPKVEKTLLDPVLLVGLGCIDKTGLMIISFHRNLTNRCLVRGSQHPGQVIFAFKCCTSHKSSPLPKCVRLSILASNNFLLWDVYNENARLGVIAPGWRCCLALPDAVELHQRFASTSLAATVAFRCVRGGQRGRLSP